MINKDSNFFNKQAVVSYSGGMDSTCLILSLLAGGYKVSAYSFDYGQAHSVELERAQENVAYLQGLGLPVQHQIINVRDVFSGDPSTLVQHMKSPEGDYREESMKSTVVSNRNCIFSAIIFGKALSLAKKSLEKFKINAGVNQMSEEDARDQSTVVISLGVHAGDHSIYPDCTEESVNTARYLYKISNWDSDLVKYETPFVNLNKGTVLKVGIQSMKDLGISHEEQDYILAHTISCYNATSDGKSCGKCGTCTERLEAFAQNGIKDPAPYVE